MKAPLLELRDLSIDFPIGSLLGRRWFRALHDVSMTVARGEIVAIVGESGSGKSTLGRAVSRLVAPSSGQVLLDGVDVLSTEPRRASLDYRSRVQMVFQDPFASLNPAHTVLHHLARPLKIHRRHGGDVRAAAAKLLADCGLEPAEEFLDAYPHRLSGGQRQRVAIARALAPQPDLLIADEPTSMLDVSIRTDVLQLLKRLCQERGLGQILITHDLAAARFIADRIMVLYAGHVMEWGSTDSVIFDPLHPYARLLLSAVVPRPGRTIFDPLPVTGKATDKPAHGQGCPFAPRCPAAFERCHSEVPVLAEPHDELPNEQTDSLVEASKALFGDVGPEISPMATMSEEVPKATAPPAISPRAELLAIKARFGDRQVRCHLHAPATATSSEEAG